MLVFCEECGCRNLLIDGEPDRQTVRFRCVSCDFENIWQQPQQKADDEAQQSAVAATGPHPGNAGKTGKN